ncbi:ClcB-like voltage-gated chloride channel protein [Horticoccus luteus]|uniref:ClcB-like voltage-gated chloride channel protein n=1 Tax=Horticoccus luteus TaxID=2862869 RepID=A0A8F9XIU8_9BACT|nr:ClcB-like voltage-gated chloride channel protein [Horticoccus luteus]QYM77978.1 ClcB-like voltage-gated chloride channel protein [Horticoccus luteus]
MRKSAAIKVVTDPATLWLRQMMRQLRWRVWLQEKLQPTEWQITLAWAALAGFLGALSSLLFASLSEGVHELLTHSSAGVVESMRELPWWATLLVPAAGGGLAGLVLLLGQRFTRLKNSTDYMEAIVIGTGDIPVRASLVKSAAALFTIGSGGSIGREGPMVQLSAMLASLIGRWRQFTRPQLRLLVACGASAGIASAYNAPIAGSFFVAEIILGTIAMESLGPLAVSAVVAALTVRMLTSAEHLYRVPAFTISSPLEMAPYVVLALIAGTLAPLFLRSLQRMEELFHSFKAPPGVRLALGGLIVGALAIAVPEVCGNGYSVVVSILNGQLPWTLLALVFLSKWVATASSVGSGAPGGVFTPSLFMGASTGFLFGTAIHSVWPGGAPDPRAFALVGMGAFLSGVSHAPVMAVIMLFEMTLSYDIILPLMLCSVIAYYTAKGLEDRSIYSDVLRRKAAQQPAPDALTVARVAELMKLKPPIVSQNSRFDEIARLFLSERVNNLYVVDADGRFLGAVSLHDIKPYLGEPDLAQLVLANDIMREDFPRVIAEAPLSDALGKFLECEAQRLPVTDATGRLLGSLSKNDLLLALVEKRKKPPA